MPFGAQVNSPGVKAGTFPQGNLEFPVLALYVASKVTVATLFWVRELVPIIVTG
jgi:hypothetical protein